MTQSITLAKMPGVCMCDDFVWATRLCYSSSLSRLFLRSAEIVFDCRHGIHARLNRAFALRRPLGDQGDKRHDGAVVRLWVTAPRVRGAGGGVELLLEMSAIWPTAAALF